MKKNHRCLSYSCLDTNLNNFPADGHFGFRGRCQSFLHRFHINGGGGDAKWPSLPSPYMVGGWGFVVQEISLSHLWQLLANDVSQNNGGASFKPVKFFSIINHTFDHFGTVCNDSVHHLSLFLLVIDISCCWVTTKDFHCQFLWIGRVSHNCFHYCSKVCVRTLLM